MTSKSLTTAEFYALLNLDTTLEKEDLVIEQEGKSGLATERAEASPTALQLDQWDRKQGELCLERSEVLKKHNLSQDEVADFFGAGFLMEPTFNDRCVDERRTQFLQMLMETSDYQDLHNSTCLNELASELATNQFGEQYALLKEKDEKRKDKPGKDPAKDAAKAEGDLLRAVSQALKEATRDVDDLDNACRSLGGDGGQDGRMDVKKVTSLYQRIKNNPQLKRITELAGRFRLLAQAKQRQKVNHGQDDVVGVVLDGDVGRLLPSELVQLADEDLEWDAARRLVERQSMCRQYQGVEKLGKGPIVVVVDESGSMQGEPVALAKAFALSMAWIAKKQKRWCCLIGYSGGTDGNLLTLPPNGWDEGKLLDWLEHFFNNGTDLDIPLRELPTTYWKQLNPPKGKTDVILITDALCRAPQEMVTTFNAWKKQEQVRCISLIINNEPGDLTLASDEVHRVKSINTNEEGVERCLSL